MNTRSSSKKNCEDSPLASTPSTSRISSEDFSSYYDDEDCTSDDDGDHDVSILQHKLGCLKETYNERKLENTVLEKCMEVKKLSTFMDEFFSNKELNDSISEEQKGRIKSLYEKNRELFSKLKHITKLNKESMKEILELHTDVQDLMEERKKLWDEAIKTHKLNLGDASAFLSFDDSDQLSASNYKHKEKEYIIRGMDYDIVMKSFRIIRVARILYNLIINSKVNWSRDKNLLEILNCTSKMLDRDFDLKNHAQCMKTVDELTQRLNKVKI